VAQFGASVNIAFQCSITYHIELNEVQYLHSIAACPIARSVILVIIYVVVYKMAWN